MSFSNAVSRSRSKSSSSRSSASSSEDECECCDHDHGHGHDNAHEHSHGHEGGHAHDHGHDHGHASQQHDHDHGHGHGHGHEHTHQSAHDHSNSHGHEHACSGGGCCEDDDDSVSSQSSGESCDCCADHAPGYAALNPQDKELEEDECASCKAHTHADHTHTVHSHSHSRSPSLSEPHSARTQQPARTLSHSHSHSHRATHSHNASRSHSRAFFSSGVAQSPLTELLLGPAQTETETDIEAGPDAPLLPNGSTTPNGSLSGAASASASASGKSLLCSSCDPTSTILHVVQVTRFRVANLCCAGEEKLIREALGDMTGVEHVAINIVGRYAVVKHCTVPCCAPSEKILDTLNALHLGVSIHEVGEDEDAKRESVDYFALLHVLVVLCLFLTGMALYVQRPTHALSKWVFVPSIALGLLPIVYNACISLFWRHVIDINTLIVVAVCGALGVDEFFDASLVVAMFLAAEFIESAVMVFVRNAISLSTSSSMPQRAFTIDGRSLRIEELKIGDVLAVRAGEMLVCDGVVVRGEGVVDESSLTGEPVPVHKKVGSAVLSGTVVQNGYVEVEITKNAQDSTMKQLKQAVEDVQADRGEYAALVDRFARYWTPLIVTATALLIVIGGAASNDWRGYLHRGLVLLILACPCAIVVAAPIPSVCAIATAAKGGVLVKGSTVIEKLCTVDTVAVDKTGTLTKGYFQVRNKLILFLDGEAPSPAMVKGTEGDDQLHITHKHHHRHSHHTHTGERTFYHDPYKLAVALEAKSTHPLANAIVSDYCGCIADMLAEDLVLPTVKKVRVREGVGLEGYVLVQGKGEGEEDKESVWRHVVVGNERLLSSHGGHVHATAHQESQIEAFISQNASCVNLLIVVDDLPHMCLSLADEVRSEAREFVRALGEREIRVSMLTGDHASVAQSICDELRIEDVHARLLPEQKLQWIRDAQDKEHGKRVLMIGDGINDSTALACATVGVAMGAGGTAMAVAAADVVLLNDNLSLLPTTISLCRLAKNTIMQNCGFAIAVKIAAMVLAVAGMLEFWQAVLIDIGSLLLVVLNGTKVLSFRGFRKQSTASTKIESKRGFGGNDDSIKSPMFIQEV